MFHGKCCALIGRVLPLVFHHKTPNAGWRVRNDILFVFLLYVFCVFNAINVGH